MSSKNAAFSPADRRRGLTSLSTWATLGFAALVASSAPSSLSSSPSLFSFVGGALAAPHTADEKPPQMQTVAGGAPSYRGRRDFSAAATCDQLLQVIFDDVSCASTAPNTTIAFDFDTCYAGPYEIQTPTTTPAPTPTIANATTVPPTSVAPAVCHSFTNGGAVLGINSFDTAGCGGGAASSKLAYRMRLCMRRADGRSMRYMCSE